MRRKPSLKSIPLEALDDVEGGWGALALAGAVGVVSYVALTKPAPPGQGDYFGRTWFWR